MIIDHVKVFTEDKKFTDGGIVIKNGTIEQVYTEGKRPQTEDEVPLTGKACTRYRGLLTCISTDARETTSATAAGMRSPGSQNMRLLWG